MNKSKVPRFYGPLCSVTDGRWTCDRETVGSTHAGVTHSL